MVNTLHCISGQNRTDTIQEENTSSGLNHEVNIFFPAQNSSFTEFTDVSQESAKTWVSWIGGVAFSRLQKATSH